MKIKIQMILAIVLLAMPLFSAEITEKEEQQLKNYKDLTRWILDQKDNFEAVIQDNAKQSTTKWVIDESQGVSKSENNVTPSQEVSKELNDFYIVKKGDTLYSISKKYNIPVADIKQINNIQSDKSLTNGTKIYLKKTSQDQDVKNDKIEDANTKYADALKQDEIDMVNQLPEYKFYKVKQGDTLSSISKKHNMTNAELIKLNDLTPPYELTIDVPIKVKSNYNKVDASKYVDSFIWPVVGRLLIPFGPQSGGVINEGINIASKLGVSVKAVQAGIVVYVGNSLENFGNIVLIQHDKGWVSAYAHMDNIKVSKGDTVSQGQPIGEIGTTGGVSQPQLHFELRQNVKPMDPLLYLNSYR